MSAWTSPNPARAAVERWWLWFTPVWSGLVGALMISGVVDYWGDVPCMLLGVGLGAGALIPPVLWPHASDASAPWWDRTAFKCGLAVFLLALGTNYTQAPFFYDVLHMHYGFQTTWNIDRTPIFLHFLSCAYFSTYFALCALTFRRLRATALPPALAWILAPLAMAFLETLLNANGVHRHACSATTTCRSSCGSAPWPTAWCSSSRCPAGRWPSTTSPAAARTWLNVAAWTLAALYADQVALDLRSRSHLSRRRSPPSIHDAPGLRDVGASCLEPIR
jgi:hypothetical protein